jgi:hypothetical protein
MSKFEEISRLGTGQQAHVVSSIAESQTSPPLVSNCGLEPSKSDSISLNQRAEISTEVNLNLSCNLGSFPGSSIVSLTFADRGTRSDYRPDLISSGLISLEEAEKYFKTYQRSMEPCICQILAENDCLANVRARSSLLTAAICTVGSLSADLTNHQRCYDVFINEVTSGLFSRNHSYDDVRALCIGAFWLSKTSSTLIALGMFSSFHNMLVANG